MTESSIDLINIFRRFSMHFSSVMLSAIIRAMWRVLVQHITDEVIDDYVKFY